MRPEEVGRAASAVARMAAASPARSGAAVLGALAAAAAQRRRKSRTQRRTVGCEAGFSTGPPAGDATERCAAATDASIWPTRETDSWGRPSSARAVALSQPNRSSGVAGSAPTPASAAQRRQESHTAA